MSTATPGWPGTRLRGGCGFNLQDNAFTALDDPDAAQELADSFAELKWTKILDRLARRVNPLMCERWFRGLCYYWVVDQAEYATDLIFYRPRCAGRSLSAAAGPRRGQLLGAGHPRLPGAAAPSPVRWRGAHRLPEGSPSRCADQASGEEQLAEDVRQVRPGAADRGGDQRPRGSSACGGCGPVTGAARWSGAR